MSSQIEEETKMPGTGMELSNEEQILLEAFNIVDKDGNGFITVAELGLAMRATGSNPTDDELLTFAKELDTDGSGKIEFPEFRASMLRFKKNHKNTESEITNAFGVFDKNKDGYICAAELKVILKDFGQNMSSAEIEEMIATADVDGDGRINYEEFSKFLCQPYK